MPIGPVPQLEVTPVASAVQPIQPVGEIGARGRTLETIDSHLEDEEVLLKSNLSDEIEIDLTDAITNLTARQAAYQASLSLAAQYCPRRAEGFAFAGLMSVSNLADICSINAGAFLYEHVFDSRLAPLILVSAATTAFAAVLVPWLELRATPVDSTT